jgi:multidrug efflux pump
VSVTQGVLFVPVVLLGNLWFGLPGVVRALTVTEVAVLLVGVVLRLASRGAIRAGLGEGSPQRAEAALERAAG